MLTLWTFSLEAPMRVYLVALQEKVHKVHKVHTARRLPHGDGPATCARVPAWDLCRVPATVSHHGAQPPRGRTSTTVDGSGPSLSATPYQGHPIVTRTNLVSARVGWCSLNDNGNYRPR